jgi:hypothetical protein
MRQSAALVSVLLAAALARAAVTDDANDEVFFEEQHVGGTCQTNMRLMWTVDTGSAAFAAPLITDLYSDGHKDIIIPTFTHYIEALDGATGNDVHGWPFAHPKMRTQVPVKLFDLERDGTPEIMVSTYNGEFVFFRENGTAIIGATLKLERTRMKKQWTNLTELARFEQAQKDEKVFSDAMAARHKIAMRGNVPAPTEKPAELHRDVQLSPAPTTAEKPSPAPTQVGGRKLQQADEMDEAGPPKPYAAPDAVNDMDAAAAEEAEGPEGAPLEHDDEYDGNGHDYGDYYGDDVFGHGVEPNAPPHLRAISGTDGKLSPEALAALDLIFHPELFEAAHNEIWEQDTVFKGKAESLPPRTSDDTILVDAHILAAPVVADLDYDGKWDIIVPVSYFYDAEFYANPENMGALPPDVDTRNYVKGALVVLDAQTGAVKWQRDLTMSTKLSQFPAYLLGAPTLINLDNDGVLDIIIGASNGDLYAFDARGNLKAGWPVKAGPMHGQALAEDVNGDGHIDVCVSDTRGMVSCFDRLGKLIWDRTVLSQLTDGPVAGDVNGDGVMDLVVCGSDGRIWALDGRIGGSVPGFPVQLGTKERPAGVFGAPLLINLNDTTPPHNPEQTVGLHIVVTAMDGAMYVISGSTGCIERHDIGHHSYTPVLADDIIGNGKIDLVVTTLTGQVFVFETDAPFTPLKAWPSQVIGVNGLTARDGHLGVMISPESRVTRHVRGESFLMMFEIVDNRHSRLVRRDAEVYFVAIHVGHQLLLYARLYLAPGKHTVRVPVPYERKYATVFVTMRLPNGQHFEDSVALAFNMHFMDGIKYLVLVPFLAVMTVLFFVHKRHTLEPQLSRFDEEVIRAHMTRRRRVRYPGLE